MIRHRPYGSEHPYQTSDDQRVPPRPLAGEPIQLRALANSSVTSVTCEWDAGGIVQRFPLHHAESVAAATATSGAATHLSAAASRDTTAGKRWVATAPALAEGAMARYRLTACAGNGRTRTTRWHTVSAATWRPDGGVLLADGNSRIVAESVRWLTDTEGVHRVRFAVSLADDEHVLGFGERFDYLDQRGQRLDAVVFEQYKGQAAAHRTYLPMPFAHVIGGAGWGFHVRTSRRTWFDVGASAPNLVWIEADLGGQPQEELTVAFYDGNPQQVLSAFLDETGHPQRLPAWVHRLWASGNEWNTQQRINEIVRRHREENIPVGVVVIEAWSDESTFTAFRDAAYEPHVDGAPHRLADFTFPPDGAWPDPKGMVDELHAHDIKVLLWQIPLHKMRPHPTGQAKADARTMVQRGYCVQETDGRPYRNRGWWFPLALMPDFTSPQAREWWLAKRRYLIEDIGIDGFKTDGGEHAWGHDLRYANGLRGDEANNLYPVYYAAAYGELLKQAGKPPVTFSRAGFTGSPAHGCIWAGDEDSTWEAYRASLIAGLTAAASGIVYWGWDLGGFSGPLPSAELYLRSAAAACFVPIMQYHSEYNHHRTPSRDRTPWNVAEQTGDPAVLEIFRKFAQLRDRLVPYLGEQAAAAIGAGMPLMRALPLMYPDDQQTWGFPTQFMLGDALLVSPITEPNARTWPCYLPDGDWVDVWSGQKSRGPIAITAYAPLERIPVWCRANHWPTLRAVFDSHTGGSSPIEHN